MFNHQDRHEVCDIYGAPQAHSLSDGHAHWHHLDAAEAHVHGSTLFAAGHTHGDVFHDPCDQAGMLAISFADAPPFVAPPLPDAVIGTLDLGVVDVILRDAREPATLDVPSLIVQEVLAVNGDADLARFPGSGTTTDPYVIEGYHIRHLLSIKDTTKCIVVRNNVVYNDAFQGPLVEPTLVIDVQALVASLLSSVEQLADALEALTAQLAEDELSYGPLAQEYADLMAQNAALTAQWEELLLILEWENLALVELNDAALVTMAQIGTTRDALAHELLAQGIELPPTPDVIPIDPAFSSFVADVQGKAAAATQTEEIGALRKQLDVYSAAYEQKKGLILKQLLLVDEAETEIADFEPGWSAFQVERDAWLTDVWVPADAAHAALVASVDQAEAALAGAQAQLADAQARLADHLYEYLGLAFDTLDDLIDHVLSLLPAADEELAGRLVLDWNGQCVHAYHNVIQDLRVNRNNARTGYATGGLIENNRIFDVGQIRHFDGELRENEIGDRLYIEQYLRGAATPPPSPGDDAREEQIPGGPELVAIRPGRVINADGFNEAWMHDNVIYGSVDLDLHGHHHGAGFFARESHYHGDLFNHAYMVNATSGACLYPTPGEPGPLGTLGVPEVDALLAGEKGCLPHHDHTKRWTSVRFERNVILDPLGYGLRYEDQNHAGDDRIAASESTEELNRPHFHRTHVALANNVIMGSIWIDVFNADGIELWSDDHREVRRDPAGVLLGALDHFGATIVDSHKKRNDGWLDLTGNTVLVVDKASAVRADHDAWSAFQLADGKELTKLDVAGNAAFMIGKGFDADAANARELTERVLEVAQLPPSDAFAMTESWGGTHPPHAPSRGILLRDVADSFVRVCGNAMLGFARGLEATHEIRPDVGFLDCRDNDWGAASPAWKVTVTEYPPEEEHLLDLVRDAGDGTPVERHVHSAADHASLLVDP